MEDDTAADVIINEDDLYYFNCIMGRVNASILQDGAEFLCGLLKIPTMAIKHVFSVSTEVTLLYAPLFHWLASIKSFLPIPQQEQLDTLIAIYNNPFNQIGTPHLLYSYLTLRNLYVAPQEISIDKVYRMVNGQQKEKFLTAQFIPLQRLFTNFLSIPDVMTTIKAELAKSETSTKLCSFLDGALWKKNLETVKSRRSGTYIPILHYYDDFETCNPLGSKAGVHKLGGNYTVVLALPPRFNSVLNNLLLSEVFHSSDRTQFSNSAVFKSIISHYDILARNGILVGGEQVYPLLQLCSGDNLSINGYMGFVESFAANYCCRFCKISRHEFPLNFYDNADLYRTIENYSSDVASGAVSRTGIKEECPFNSLRQSTGIIYIHVLNNLIYCYIDNIDFILTIYIGI